MHSTTSATWQLRLKALIQDYLFYTKAQLRHLLKHDRIQQFIYEKRYGNGNSLKELKQTLNFSYRSAKKLVIAIVGGTILLLGILLIVLPGPAIIVIPAGLSILAIEFSWARRWLKSVRETIDAQIQRFKKR